MKGSGVVFTHGEGISTPHVRPKGRQPLIECANKTLIFYLSKLLPVYDSILRRVYKASTILRRITSLITLVNHICILCIKVLLFLLLPPLFLTGDHCVLFSEVHHKSTCWRPRPSLFPSSHQVNNVFLLHIKFNVKATINDP